MPRKSKRIYFPAVFFVLASLLLPGALSAQADVSDVLARRAELERELGELEYEIARQRAVLVEKQRETVSLERDVAILNARVDIAERSIRARELAIRRLAGEIGEKRETIAELAEKLERERESLAQLLRRTRELDNFSIVEVILANKNLSEFFRDLDEFTSIKAALAESFDELESISVRTRTEKVILEARRGEEEELKQIQELQKKSITAGKNEKARILKETKGEEAAYQKIIKERERDAAAIRSELFALRGTDAIPFEKALELANVASEKTGARPAFILGVIAHESELGENVGQCLLTNDPEKGDGKGVNTGRIFKKVMKPDRDVDIFINVVTNLGLDPFKMVVSCPPSYGYGGAMGPAQFIPSTWVIFEKKVARLTGNNPPNPWNPLDAFMAAGVLLSENGASKGTHDAERLAALRYFAGWKNATNPRYGFYGDAVMELAGHYQGLIDILQSN